MEHNDGTVGIVFKIVTFEKKPTNMEKKRFKKNNQTWIKAKSLPTIVFKTPPPKIPQTWKQKD